MTANEELILFIFAIAAFASAIIAAQKARRFRNQRDFLAEVIETQSAGYQGLLVKPGLDREGDTLKLTRQTMEMAYLGRAYPKVSRARARAYLRDADLTDGTKLAVGWYPTILADYLAHRFNCLANTKARLFEGEVPPKEPFSEAA